jgi:hypothetical protein
LSSAGITKFALEEGLECGSVTSEGIPADNAYHQSSLHHPDALYLAATYNLEPVFIELQEIHEEIDRLWEELKDVKVSLQSTVLVRNNNRKFGENILCFTHFSISGETSQIYKLIMIQ